MSNSVMVSTSSVLQPPVVSQSASMWCGVETYWGKIGDGKTHHIVKYRVLPALSQGRHVFCNIDFGGPLKSSSGAVLLTSEERAGLLLSQYLDKDVRQYFHIVDNEWLRQNLVLKDMDGELLQVPHGSRVIIDEAQMLFPIDGYRAANPLFFKLLTYCRHFDIDFCFVTQNPALLDKRIISTSNELIMIKNLWFLSTFFKNRYQVSHHQNLFAEPHQKKQVSFDKSIFLLFKSSGSIVQRQSRFMPVYMVIPVFGLLLWGANILWHGGTLPLLKTHTAVSVPSKDLKDAPAAVQVPAAPPVRPSGFENVMQQVAKLESNSTLPLPVESEVVEHAVFHNALLSKPKGHWRLEKDGSSTWVRHL